jgi:hypothetical protein
MRVHRYEKQLFYFIDKNGQITEYPLEAGKSWRVFI